MAGNLTARKVETAKPGKYSDGGNLYLIVAPTGTRKWVLRFTWRGKAKEMGLGSAALVSLAEARERAISACRKVANGINPIEDRKRAAGIPTFGAMVDIVHEALSAGFRNEKHKTQWKSTDVAPRFYPFLSSFPAVVLPCWAGEAAGACAEPLA